MDSQDDLGQGLKHFGLKFVSPVVEREYHEWRLDRILPLIRIVIIAGMIAWLASYPLVYLADPQIFAEIKNDITYLTPLIFIPACFLVVLRGWRRIAIPTVVVLQILSAFALQLQTYYIDHSPGGVAVWATFAAIFSVCVRLPPLWSVVAIGPIMTLLAGIQIDAFRTGAIPRIDVFNFIGAPFLTFMLIIIVSISNDRLSRLSFLKDKIIQDQHQMLDKGAKIIRRYVPLTVAEHIFDGHEAMIDVPQRRRITVLFADIVGFTEMADCIDAESLTQIVGEYMDAMVNIIDAHGGSVTEFAGDGFMALFGAPHTTPPEAQVSSAVDAALAMRERLPSLNHDWFKLGIEDTLKFRVGINTGVLSVGSFGSMGRMTYTAIGLQANIAARIQTECNPNQVFLSHTSWQLIKDRIHCEFMGKFEVKGVHHPLKIYEVRTGM